MTREEAIKNVKRELCRDCGIYLGGGRECPENCFVIETINALSAESCEDCISRQAVLDAITGAGTFKYETKEVQAIAECLRKVEQLPPVTPQPKTGRWIFDEILDKHYYCSECKSMGVNYWDYCPNCGAKMESEE